MARPKISPCPECETAYAMDVYTYETTGSRRVECGTCLYTGPCEQSIKKAIEAHNASVAEATP